MEKSRYSSKPPSYDEFEGLRQGNIIENTGVGFTVGTVGGLLYNIYKFKAGRINRKLLLPNAVRVGGFGALLSLSIELSTLAMGHLRGTPGKENVMDIITCTAASAALMWSPRGLRSASRAGLVAGGLISAFAGTLLNLERAESSMSKFNTYHYPHYRLQNNRLETILVRQFD